LSCVKKYFFAMLSVFAVSLLAVFSQTYAAETRPSLSGLQAQINQQQVEIDQLKNNEGRTILLDTGWLVLDNTEHLLRRGENVCAADSQSSPRCIVHYQLQAHDGTVHSGGGWINHTGDLGNIYSIQHDSGDWEINYAGSTIRNTLLDRNIFFKYRIIVEYIPR